VLTLYLPTALLPEGFTPAPRETEADKSGDVRTLDRRLKDRIFLTVQDGEDSKWGLPTIVPKKDETLLDAAKRVVKDKVGGQLMDLYCASNAPVAVNFKVFTEEERKDGFFGVKTFFMRVQHDEGNVSKKDMQVKDFAWLDRSEVVARVQEEQGLRQSKLYRYML
jgi:large subunit ribosomal protein L46